MCAALGAALLLVDQRPTERLARQLREAGGDAEAFRCDVISRAEVEALAASTGPVDALVLAAGICPWDDSQDPGWDERFEQVLSVTVHGPIHFARACLPAMTVRGRGRIVLVGSVGGGWADWSRARTMSLRRAGRMCWSTGSPGAARRGVLVNGVAPGAIETAMTRGQPTDPAHIPLGRKGEAEEVAWPMAFLCSPVASYITGTVLDVNGGLYMN